MVTPVECEVDEDDYDDDEDVFPVASYKRRRKSGGIAGDEDETDQLTDMRHFEWKPLYSFSEWIDARTMVKMLTLVVLLPSGVGSRFTGRVIDNGCIYEIVCQWPPVLFNPLITFKKWIDLKELSLQHPKISGLHQMVAPLRGKLDGASVESTCQINLPFRVQAHILSESRIATKDGSKYIVVEMKAFVEEYSVLQVSRSFETVC